MRVYAYARARAVRARARAQTGPGPGRARSSRPGLGSRFPEPVHLITRNLRAAPRIIPSTPHQMGMGHGFIASYRTVVCTNATGHPACHVTRECVAFFYSKP